jgi:L-seryl-tRNA(Ser) seleniumtransferase
LGELARAASERARKLAEPLQARVINATGVVLHTNLGRAPLSEPARRAIAEAASGYLSLEYDVPEGRRSHRALGVEAWLTRLTGAEAALAVNNGAAALLLVVSALAQGRKVVVSRGELVEIGGSFRLPEILRKAGATLVEVGTTNRTRLDDYRRALTPEVALILKVHPSNFRLVGFAERPEREELAALAHDANVAFVEDVGSGALFDTRTIGLEHEPTVLESLNGGADLVTFSADKLLGGPQAGLVVGRRDRIAALKRDPLARALRIDKLTVAALEATLAAYVDLEHAREQIPALALLAAPADAIQAQAERLRDALLSTKHGLVATVVPQASEVGGGALPGASLPTFAVALEAKGRSAAVLERLLRLGRPPIIARIQDDRVLLDARTLLMEDPAEIARIVGEVLAVEA